MKNCIEINFKNIILGVNMRFANGGDNVYKSVLTYIVSKFEIDDVSQFLTYSIDPSTVKDPDLKKHMILIRGTLASIGSKYGYDLNEISTGIAEAAKAITISMETPFISAKVAQSNEVISVAEQVTITEVQVTDNTTGITPTDELPSYSGIIKMPSTEVKTVPGVYKHYLKGENGSVTKLSTKSYVLVNAFKRLIQKNWLSTNIADSKKIIDNFSFSKVSKNMKADAKAAIDNYYKQSADAIGKASSGRDIIPILFFTDATRIPGESEGSIMSDGTIFYKSEFVNGIIIYAPNGVSVDMDISVGLNEYSKNKLTQISDIEISNVNDLAPELKPKRITKEFVEADSENERFLNAYMSHIILAHFQTFVDYGVKELSEMYVEEVRKGAAEVDIVGTNMATKFTKLGLLSTPKIHENSDNVKTLKKIKSIPSLVSSSGKSAIEYLNNLELIKEIDGNKNTVFTYTYNGQLHTSIVVNVGTTLVVFTNKLYNFDNGITRLEWVVNFPDAQGVRHDFIDINQLDPDFKLDTNLTSGIHEVLNILNTTSVLDLSTKTEFTSVNLNASEAINFIESINSKQALLSNNDTFNVSTFKGNDNDSFIDPNHVKASAGKLASIPFNFKKAGNFLLELSKEPGAHGSIARALYYKYFHIGEYKITAISPITNLLETTTHQSIYEKARQTGDKAAWDALVAIIVELHSTALDNKTFLSNNYLIKSSVENANNIEYLINSINSNGLEERNNAYVIPEETIKPFFKVTLDQSGSMHIQYYKFGYAAKFGSVPEITSEFTVIGNSVKGDIPFTLVKEMLEKLRMPNKMLDDNLYEAMKMAYDKSNNPKTEVNNFYGKLIALRLSNVVNKLNESTFESNLDVSNGQLFKYGFINNLGNAKEALSTALDLTFSRSFSSVFTGPTGTEFSTTIYSNLSKDKKDYIAKLLIEFAETGQIPELLKNNGFTKKGLWEVIGEFTRLGLKVGVNGKDTNALNKQELLSVMVNSFIQHTASKASGFTEVLISEDTMSDRSKIDMFVIKLLNGKSTAPSFLEDGLIKLKETELRDRFFDVQTKSFSAMQDHIVKEWKSVFEQMALGSISIKSAIPVNMKDVSKAQTIRDIYNLLQKYKLDYSHVLHKTGLVDQFTAVGESGGIVSLNYSTVQLSEVVLGKDMDKKNFYLDMYHNEFMAYAADNNYKITKTEIQKLESAFTYLSEFNNVEKEIEASNLALKIFFYNDSTFSQELTQFGMGSVFQYKTKVKSLMEKIYAKTKKGASVKTILDKIEIHNFDYDGTFERGITTKMEYDELKAFGSLGNAPSSIKCILNSGLSDAHKLLLIEYIDTFAQISPQFVGRVKRNQANGTSGLSPFLISNDEAGMFLGQYEKTLLIEDPKEEIFTLNSGIKKGLETFDGSQLITPEYAYKLNKSLGNRFSNFRSTSFYKTVNPAKTKDGVATYEKLAAFSMYTWEMMTLATPEHHSFHAMMMDKEKFSNPEYGTSYTGLYLIPQAYIKTPNSAKFNKTLQGATIQDQIAELKKHGEYLGKLQITLTDKSVKDVDAAVLLVQLEDGKINESDIVSIKTNKTFIDSTLINSKFDLYNYYGGIKTNTEMLMLNDTEVKKNIFLSEFPFGWVELQIAEIMSNYRGTEKNYPIRNASINKINFVSTVKTGRSKVNPVNIVKSKNINYDDVQVSEVSNEFLSVILNAEHNYDVSSELSISASQDNNSIAMMTQMISNSAAEGNTATDVQKMNRALSKLTDFQLTQLQKEIDSYGSLVNNEDSTAEKQYAVNLVREKVKSMEAPENVLIALGSTSKDAAKLSLDLRMIHPLLRSAVNSEFNKRGIKQRFSGGQYVLAPIKDVIKRYDYFETKGLFRSTIKSIKNKNGIDRYNSINGIIKDEVTAEGFNGLLKDVNWSLKSVTSLRQLIDEHSMMDFVYLVKDKVVIIDNIPIIKKVYEAILVQDILSNNLKLDDIVSPWIDEPGSISFDNELGAKGKDLKWMNYYKDGVSLFDTDEFHSFYLSGKAPSTLKKMDETSIKKTGAPASIYEKLDFFKTEMKSKTNVVPKLLWTRFLLDVKHGAVTPQQKKTLSYIEETINLNPNLAYSKVIGKLNTDLSYTLFEKAVLDMGTNEQSKFLMDAFFKYIQNFAGSEYKLTNVMKYQMVHMLNQDGWVPKEAEFIMPPQHQAAFLIRFGDALQDILGSQEQPDLVKMASIVKLTPHEISLLGRYYVHAKGDEEIEKIYTKIQSTNHPEAIKYLKLRQIQQDKMKIYFGERIADIRKVVPEAADSEYKVLKKRAPLFILENAAFSLNSTEEKENFKKILYKFSKDIDIHSNINMLEFVLQLQGLASNINLNKGKIQQLISDKTIEFIETWKTGLANNFEKSLTFITARIPADAKHQTALGKIVGFVYSTKNVIYSPIELLAMSGADFDVDKQNNLTWHVKSDGKLVDWRDIENKSGELDLEFAEEKINRSAQTYKRMLEGIMDDAGNALYSKEEILNKSTLYKRRINAELKDAVQNFVVEKLMHIAGSSKNAVESSTVVAMSKLGVLNDYLASFNFSEIDIKNNSLETIENIDPKTGKKTKRIKIDSKIIELINKRQLAIPYAPNTKMFYEKINMDGKTGISAYASAIKTYMAVFNAAISNDTIIESIAQINNILDKTTLLEDENKNLIPISVEDIYTRTLNAVKNKNEIKYIEFGTINGKYIRPIWKDPKTGLYVQDKELIYPANSERFMPKTSEVNSYPLFHTEIAKKTYRDMMSASSPEEEAKIVLAYKESLISDEKFAMAPQAWKDFSELLNASTDNAKELILSTIGANSTTNSIIATMIAMGVDLKTTLLLINDPIIQNEVKLHDDDKSLVNPQKDFIKSFSVRLKDRSKNYRPDFINENLEAKIRRAYPKYSDKQIAQELEIQTELFSKYNPASQMAIFTDAATEFTNLSGILGINTGMKNSEIETFNYLMKLERALKIDGIKITLADFFDEDNPSKIKEMIDKANEPKSSETKRSGKTAFNIPYIIYSNKVFYNYLKTLYKANEMIKSLSYTTFIMDSKIKPLLKKARKLFLEDVDMYQFNEFLSNIGISTYYSKQKDIDRIFYSPELDKKYDLSIPNDRLKFIKDMPRIKELMTSQNEELNTVKFLSDLQLNSPFVNKETGKSLALFGGINTKIIKDWDRESLSLDLQLINKISPKLYTALEHYSLIVDKGGLGKSSIVSLFGFESIRKYNDHLVELKDSGAMESIVANIHESLLGVMLPMTLKRLSTMTGINNREYLYKSKDRSRNASSSEEHEVFNDDEFEEGFNENNEFSTDWGEEISEEEYRLRGKDSTIEFKFDVLDVNKIKTDGVYIIGNTFVSQTNGLTYGWFSEKIEGSSKILESYIPITRDIDPKVGNINIKYGGDLKHSLLDIGFNFGWEIKLQNGDLGRLLGHVSIDGSSAGDSYYVKVNDKVIIYSGEVLRNMNPQFRLEGKAITLKKGSFEATKASVIYWEVKNGKNITSDIASPNSNTLMYLGDHMSYHKGSDIVIGKLRLAEDNILSKKPESGISFEDFKNKVYDESIINVLSSIMAHEIIQREINKDATYKIEINGVKSVFNYSHNLLMKLGVKSEVKSEQNFIDFKNRLFSDPNRTELYEFIRKTDAEKLRFINAEIIPVGETLLETVYFEDKNFQEVGNVNKITSIGSLFDGRTPILSDYEFLLDKSLDNVTIKQYAAILEKLGISKSEYRKLAKIDLLVIKTFVEKKPDIGAEDIKSYIAIDEVFHTPDFKTKNNTVSKVLKSAASGIILDTRLSPVKEKEKVKIASPKVTARLATFLNKRFANTTVEVMSIDDIKINYPHVTIETNDEAIVNIGQGHVVLIKNRVTLDTFMHEMLHLYLAELKEKNLALYNNLMEKIVDDPIINKVKKAYFNENYYTNEDILEEAFVFKLQELYAADFSAQFLLENNLQFDGLLENNEHVLGNVTDMFSSLFEDFFGGKFKGEKLEMTDSLADIMRKIGIDLIFKDNSELKNMDRNDVVNLKTILKSKNMTENSAIKKLIDEGLMKKICK